MAELPRSLGVPTAALIPRVVDSLSFLYLDTCRITQDDHGVLASVESDRGQDDRVYLPSAAIAAVLLGPGTSITHRAMVTFASSGAALIAVGDAGIRCYSTLSSINTSTRLIERQAAVVSDPELRLRAARVLYARRFVDLGVPDGLDISQLRGLEGHRVRAIYKAHAERVGITFRRMVDFSDNAAGGPVNQALSAANSCLYGIVTAASIALGCHPALGIIHTGHAQSFVFDIADQFKADLTIPLAFDLHDQEMPERQVRRRFREQFTLLKSLPKVVAEIHAALGLSQDNTSRADHDTGLINLWDPDLGAVRGGTSHHDEERRCRT